MMAPSIIQLAVTLAFAFAASPSNAALEVIGSGYGRTGTDTLREALTELGYKTYHMREIIDRQLASDLPIWHAQAENDCSDIDALRDLFEEGGWTAAVDFPASMCYESLMKAFPDAKVIHTERKSSEQWWDSASNSILIVGSLFPFNVIYAVVPFFIAHKEMCNALWTNILGNSKKVRTDDDDFPHAYKDQFLAAYEANNARVSKVVPRKRLLIQDHSKGWTDLCQFLGKEVPQKSYPHSNKRADFYKTINTIAVNVIIGITGAILMFAFALKKLISVFVKNDSDKVKKV